MNKILRYSLSLVLALIANLSLMAAEPYKVLTFPDDNKANNKVNDYTSSWEAKVGTDTWTITNFNNYQWNGWTYIKCGSKKVASVATIESPIFDKEIGCVVVTFDKVTAANVNGISVTFETEDEDAAMKSYTKELTNPKAGEIIFENVGLPENKVKCTLTIDCQKSSNGIVQISKIEYYKVGDEPGVDPVQTVDNIAAFKAIGANKQATLTLKNAQVQYVGTDDMFIVDATGGIDIYKSDLEYTAGQILNGTITATYDEFNNLPELKDITDNKLTATDGTVTPVEMTIEEAAKAENACKLVTVKNVTLIKALSGTYTNYYTDEDQTLQIYDKFKLAYTPNTESAMDYTGILIPFKNKMELAPTVEPTTSTGITTITANEAAKNAPAYNLAGQKVSNSYKGVVIKAGKKFVQK